MLVLPLTARAHKLSFVKDSELRFPLNPRDLYVASVKPMVSDQFWHSLKENFKKQYELFEVNSELDQSVFSEVKLLYFHIHSTVIEVLEKLTT